MTRARKIGYARFGFLLLLICTWCRDPAVGQANRDQAMIDAQKRLGDALDKQKQQDGGIQRLLKAHRNFVLAFNASICRLRSDLWFGVMRRAWDQYAEEIIREDGITYAQANALLQKVRSNIEMEFGPFPAICKALLDSPIMDRLDEIERRVTGNYH
jgi:hypothetical protein